MLQKIFGSGQKPPEKTEQQLIQKELAKHDEDFEKAKAEYQKAAENLRKATYKLYEVQFKQSILKSQLKQTINETESV
jgi:uncharacterized protein (DUF3084 family)